MSKWGKRCLSGKLIEALLALLATVVGRSSVDDTKVVVRLGSELAKTFEPVHFASTASRTRNTETLCEFRSENMLGGSRKLPFEMRFTEASKLH